MLLSNLTAKRKKKKKKVAEGFFHSAERRRLGVQETYSQLGWAFYDTMEAPFSSMRNNRPI